MSELLDFKQKIFDTLGVSDTSEISDALLHAVLHNDIAIFDKISSMQSEEKDMLQSLWQYYESDREEKKQDYTPKSLCKLVSAIAGDYETVYDCCGGSGALTIETAKNEVYVEEIDERVIPFLLTNLCMRNLSGYVVNGNVLTGSKNVCYKLSNGVKYSTCEIVDYVPEIKCDVSVSNPPYNIKWDPPLPMCACDCFPVMPPASNANYAFAFRCLEKSDRAVMIMPCGAMSSKQEQIVREYLVNCDWLETVAMMPDNMFESTTISTCIMVIDKHKKHPGEFYFMDCRNVHETECREQRGQFGGASHTNRVYKKQFNIFTSKNVSEIVDTISNRKDKSGFFAVRSAQDIRKENYNISPSRYIEFPEQESRHRELNEIADNINYICRMRNSCKLVINETIAKQLGLDVDLFKKAKKQSENSSATLEQIGIHIEKDDYIQFTKNKNEFCFKCNSKDAVPGIFIQFFSVWKNQIDLMNTMENQYMSELRDAMLPDLMIGKIDVSEVVCK